ncbi:hypothetical protein HY643_00645 [Candidatus Woesearchaeota archaeon]|nr:hypothetical protein [Candidatus Woesearchaeota archaeon]
MAKKHKLSKKKIAKPSKKKTSKKPVAKKSIKEEQAAMQSVPQQEEKISEDEDLGKAIFGEDEEEEEDYGEFYPEEFAEDEA